MTPYVHTRFAGVAVSYHSVPVKGFSLFKHFTDNYSLIPSLNNITRLDYISEISHGLVLFAIFKMLLESQVGKSQLVLI
jgi:hypothetical protein